MNPRLIIRLGLLGRSLWVEVWLLFRGLPLRNRRILNVINYSVSVHKSYLFTLKNNDNS